jgi:hypothetical protein
MQIIRPGTALSIHPLENFVNTIIDKTLDKYRDFGLYRTKGGGGIARIVFRQTIQKSQLILCVLARIFVKYAGKIDRKTRRRSLCGAAFG